MSTKRRRILDDDEDDNEGIKVHEEVTAKDMVSRMLRHAKKTNVKLGITKSDSGDLEKKNGIPRKSQSSQPPIRTTEIPKKAKVIESPGNQPTLLTQSMLPVQTQKAPTTTPSATQPAPSTSTITSTRPPISQKDSSRRPTRLPQTTSNESRQSPVRPDNPDAVLTTQQPLGHQHAQAKSQSNATVKVLTDSERQVVKSIQTLCDKIQLNLTPSDDILSGSFLDYSTDADWEDLNSLTGKKIPIFPEDFGPGQSPWPLSWWGIVEPPVPNDVGGPKGLNTRDGWHNQRRQDSEYNRSRGPPNTSVR